MSVHQVTHPYTGHSPAVQIVKLEDEVRSLLEARQERDARIATLTADSSKYRGVLVKQWALLKEALGEETL